MVRATRPRWHRPCTGRARMTTMLDHIAWMFSAIVLITVALALLVGVILPLVLTALGR